ncbi:MAG: radical SAM protein [Candidatus Eremiobacteraeota bacterium]|nr:radical SAM protein [Candidatus Eremiobacteraeota bacterium]
MYLVMGTFPEYRKTKKKVITRRGCIWLGQTCNLRCRFCYFVDRVKARSHPEHPFMAIEKAKKICSVLVSHYHNNSVDIQGGEPTIYPWIYELCEHCSTVGLLPTLITNAIVLAKKDVCRKFMDAGVRDFLISVHGLGEGYDGVVGLAGAHTRQMKALENLGELGVPFRFNTVLSKWALPDLSRIARIAIDSGARVVNFISFNPFEDQKIEGKRSSENVPRYREVKEALSPAMDLLEDHGVEVNVRYLPLCIAPGRHLKSFYNFQQLSYDIHEWDFASWSWTWWLPQRIKDGDVSKLIEIEETSSPPHRGIVKHLAEVGKTAICNFPALKEPIFTVYRKLNAFRNRKLKGKTDWVSIEELYRKNAFMRRRQEFSYAESCSECDVKEICDGFYRDYIEIFGGGEARPMRCGEKIDDPKHFINDQEKVVEVEDYDWVFGGKEDLSSKGPGE